MCFTDANNVGLKMAGNVALYIRGSGGDSGLKSVPASVLILDEVDEMDQSQIELALQRLRGQLEKTVWFISTPTVPNHGVSLEYAKSSQEHFMFKCPGCGKMDEFRFPESIDICGTDVNDPDTAKSRFQCTMCKYKYKQEKKNGIWRQDEKLQTLTDSGIWTPSIPSSQYDPDRRGFNINQLYSYTVSPGEIVVDHFKALLNPYAMQEFHKSVLGEPYIGEKSGVTDDQLINAKKDYRCGQLTPQPGERRMITMGIDQGKVSYYTIAEWFYPEATHDVNTHATCRILDAGTFDENDWEVIPDRLMHTWQVQAAMVDADPSIQEARRFARRFRGFVWLNRYRSGRTGKEMTIDDDNGNGAPLATVDRTNWLDVSLGRFFGGTIEIPMDLPVSFGNHVKNLVRLYEEKDNNTIAVYRNFGPDHFAHSLNYAEMALPCACARATNKNIKNFL